MYKQAFQNTQQKWASLSILVVQVKKNTNSVVLFTEEQTS